MLIPVIVGISGGSASGKTFIAERIQKEFCEICSVLSLDSYYKDFNKTRTDLTLINFDEPKSLDLRLFRSHLKILRQGREISVPVYDFKTHSRKKETTEFHPNRLILVDGLFLFNISLPKNIFKLKIYIDTPDEIRYNRRIERDINERGRTIDSVKKQYVSFVQPMYEKYVCPNKALADMVLDSENANDIGLKSIIMKIRALLTVTS
jgi:uridine kinase